MVITLSDSGSLWRIQLRAGHEKCPAQVFHRLGEVPEDWIQVLCKFSEGLGGILPLQAPSLFCPQSPGRTGRVSPFTHPRAGALKHTQGTVMPMCPAVVTHWLCCWLSCRTFLSCKTLKSPHQDSLGVAGRAGSLDQTAPPRAGWAQIRFQVLTRRHSRCNTNSGGGLVSSSLPECLTLVCYHLLWQEHTSHR